MSKVPSFFRSNAFQSIFEHPLNIDFGYTILTMLNQKTRHR